MLAAGQFDVTAGAAARAAGYSRRSVHRIFVGERKFREALIEDGPTCEQVVNFICSECGPPIHPVDQMNIVRAVVLRRLV